MFSCHYILSIVTLTFFCKPWDLVIFLCDDIGILQLKEIEFAPSFSTLNRHLQWKHHHGNKVKRRRLSRFSEWESSFLGNFPSLNGLARRMWPWVIYSNLYPKDFCSTLGEIGISFKILILVRSHILGVKNSIPFLDLWKCNFLGPRGPHGIPSLVSPSVRPLVRKKNLDHIYTGLYASWIIWRLIKPAWWPHGIP